MVATRLVCASCICTLRSASSPGLRSVRSSTKATPWSRCSSNAAEPSSTGTRLPSLRHNSFSYGCNLPVISTSSTARAARAPHPGGVRSVQRRRPAARDVGKGGKRGVGGGIVENDALLGTENIVEQRFREHRRGHGLVAQLHDDGVATGGGFRLDARRSPSRKNQQAALSAGLCY